MMDFIEANFLAEQIHSIKQRSHYVNTLRRLGEGLGEYHFDKTTLGGSEARGCDDTVPLGQDPGCSTK